MISESAKIPVEYIIMTTSDWTMFEIIEGGEWQNLHVECKECENRLAGRPKVDNKSIRIDKREDEGEPIVLNVKCILAIPKDPNRSNLKYRITKGDRESTVVTTIIKGKKSMFMVNNNREGSDGGTNPKTFDLLASEYLPNFRKDKVFIVHGRDNHQALLLNKHLHNLGVNALMFDDLPDKGKTIIEQIEYIRDNISYAFVILTPDDVGCLREDGYKISSEVAAMKTSRKENLNKALENLRGRARQNVILELGLFIGALGRENVCCLKQKDVKELPTDINGVLYKEFENNVNEVFFELREELGI